MVLLRFVLQGTFVATYVGEVLTMADAEAREDKRYQLTLQVTAKRLSRNQGASAAGGESDAESEGAAAAAAAPKWPEAKFVIDAKEKGNVARFFNHDSSTPNLFAQMVRVMAL